MRSMRVVFGVVCLMLAVVVAAPAAAETGDGAIRIGTYDNRVIAIAYARSQYLPVGAKKTEHAAAEAAGDTSKMRAIESEMEALQRQLHYQGFGRAPVDDLLEHVALQLPALAAELDLDAITWACDFAGDGVEVVDVSEELARLYVSPEMAAEICAEVLPVAPARLDEIGHGD